jgi:hypothetical protein
MATAFTDFHEAIRALLGDVDAMDYDYTVDQLNVMLRTVAMLGLGAAPLTVVDTTSFAESFTVPQFGVVAVQAALLLLTPQEHGANFRTRALSVSGGGQAKKDMLRALNDMLYDKQAEAGDEGTGAFASRQSLVVFFHHWSGGRLDGMASEAITNKPFVTVAVT